MRQNFNIIISDTSCLIILDKIDELTLLLKMGKKVYVTPVILKEFGKIRSTNFRFDDKLFEMVLEQAGE